MRTLLAFLNVFIPAAAPILARVPELAGLVRSAFQKVGGKDEDIDAILTANQIDIDKLANPDQFRHKPAGTPAPPEPPSSTIYNVIHDAPIPPNDALIASGFAVGSWVRENHDGRWEVSEKGAAGHSGFNYLRDITA